MIWYFQDSFRIKIEKHKHGSYYNILLGMEIEKHGTERMDYPAG